jgi:tetratricopeptide (TPR) repeat protein
LLIGAHLGIVSAARATEEYSVALEHGWSALQYASGNSRAEVEALTILAALSIDVGKFDAALASCRLAIAKGVHGQIYGDLIRYIVQAALGSHDEEDLQKHLPHLLIAVERTSDPWQEAQGKRVVGEALTYLGDKQQAIGYLEASRAIAARRGYAELRYWADEALAKLNDPEREPRLSVARDASPVRTVSLSDASQSVIRQLCYLG